MRVFVPVKDWEKARQLFRHIEEPLSYWHIAPSVNSSHDQWGVLVTDCMEDDNE